MRALVELLRAGSPDLARRWLAALLLVPETDRERIVEAVEHQIVNEYAVPASDDAESPAMRVVYPPKEIPGGTEHVTVEYRENNPRKTHGPTRKPREA